ncbi:MAG: hypothetical protein AAF676_06565 [Pseudomonadota bacterium]
MTLDPSSIGPVSRLTAANIITIVSFIASLAYTWATLSGQAEDNAQRLERHERRFLQIELAIDRIDQELDIEQRDLLILATKVEAMTARIDRLLDWLEAETVDRQGRMPP